MECFLAAFVAIMAFSALVAILFGQEADTLLSAPLLVCALLLAVAISQHLLAEPRQRDRERFLHEQHDKALKKHIEASEQSKTSLQNHMRHMATAMASHEQERKSMLAIRKDAADLHHKSSGEKLRFEREIRRLESQLRQHENDAYDNTTVDKARSIQTQFDRVCETMAKAGIKVTSLDSFARAIEELCHKGSQKPSTEQLSADLVKARKELAVEKSATEAAQKRISLLQQDLERESRLTALYKIDLERLEKLSKAGNDSKAHSRAVAAQAATVAAEEKLRALEEDGKRSLDAKDQQIRELKAAAHSAGLAAAEEIKTIREDSKRSLAVKDQQIGEHLAAAQSERAARQEAEHKFSDLTSKLDAKSQQIQEQTAAAESMRVAGGEVEHKISNLTSQLAAKDQQLSEQMAAAQRMRALMDEAELKFSAMKNQFNQELEEKMTASLQGPLKQELESQLAARMAEETQRHQAEVQKMSEEHQKGLQELREKLQEEYNAELAGLRGVENALKIEEQMHQENIAARDATIAVRNDTIKQRDLTIRERLKTIKERNDQIAELRKKVVDSDAMIGQLEDERNALINFEYNDMKFDMSLLDDDANGGNGNFDFANAFGKEFIEPAEAYAESNAGSDAGLPTNLLLDTPYSGGQDTAFDDFGIDHNIFPEDNDPAGPTTTYGYNASQQARDADSDSGQGDEAYLDEDFNWDNVDPQLSQTDVNMDEGNGANEQHTQAPAENAATASTSIAYGTSPGQTRSPGLSHPDDDEDDDDSLIDRVLLEG